MKLNKKGFSSLELFGVILVAMIVITGVTTLLTKASDSQRASTFLNLAKKYAAEVKQNFDDDSIHCNVNGSQLGSNSLPNGTFSVLLDNEKDSENSEAYQNATALIRDGGKSPWGNGKFRGYITIEKNGMEDAKFYVQLIDSTGHAILYNEEKPVSTLTKSSISKTGNSIKDGFKNASNNKCRID